MMLHQFKKSERIVSQKLIDELFGGAGSHSMVAFPVRATYIIKERASGSSAPAAQLLVSVPKRRFKHAVDRNRVKRQLREAWRHHRQHVADKVPAESQVAVAFVWLADSHQPSSLVSARVKSLLIRIGEKL
ncbi:MAG: ribonuclease P protein component [Prevotella sp.]|nr:ribonuclease P protein component [Prevotella sp.]